MAYTFWRGPGARNAPLESGIYEDGLNWTRGDPPGAGDIAELTEGDYTVTLTSNATVGELRIGRGATFLFQGGMRHRLGVDVQLVNSGTLRLEAGPLVLGGTFYNYGTFVGAGASSDDAAFGGTIVNTGVIATAGRSFIITSTLDNQSGGVLRGELDLWGAVVNSGLFDADGSTIAMSDIQGTASLANLSGTMLTGGQWHVAHGGTIRLVGQAIATLGNGTEIVLDGRDAAFAVDNGAGLQALDASLRTIAAGAELHVVGRRGFGSGQVLDLRGELELRGGTLDVRELVAVRGSAITGLGTVTGEGNLGGAVRVTGTLGFTGDVTVKGAVSGGTLALAGRDNLIGPDAQVTLQTLALEGGVTRLQDGALRVRNLELHDATFDLGRSSLFVRGAVDLDGGRVNGEATLRLRGDHVTSSGESDVSVRVVNSGTITVADGTLTFDRTLSGAGTVVVSDGATLAFGTGASVTRTQAIHLDGAATLEIAAAKPFAGLLSGFGAGDTIALRGLSAETTRAFWVADADGAGGTLRLVGEGATAVLHFDDGAYTRRNFALADVDGALAVTYRGRALDAAAVFGADTAIHAPVHGAFDGVPLHTDGTVALV